MEPENPTMFELELVKEANLGQSYSTVDQEDQVIHARSLGKYRVNATLLRFLRGKYNGRCSRSNCSRLGVLFGE